MFLKLGPKQPSRDVPIAVIVPNLVTTLALCCGLASLHFILAGEWQKAMIAIVLSAVFDVLDGGAARLLRVTTKFGAMLDSLSDFLAFGIAPAMLLHQWILVEKTSKLIDTLGLIAVMVFAVCAALRLARFTSAATAAPLVAAHVPASAAPAPKPRPSPFFVGMPTPAAAGAVLVPAFVQAFVESTPALSERFGNILIPEWAVALYTFGIGLLMVSRIPMFALKGARISRRAIAPIVVVLVVVAALMLKHPWLTLAGLALIYLATIPWAMIAHRRMKTRSIKSGPATDVVAKVG
jgi:CDP-diacylglycerol--serine O-phosphatidyltransferase